MYTCKVCNHRSGRKISKQAYHKGVVLVRCPGCEKLHLISDHLGVFEEPGWTIESILKQHGENVHVVNSENILEFTRKD